MIDVEFGTISKCIEFIVEIETPGEFSTHSDQCLITAISCARGEDREGSIRLNYQRHSVEFEAPVAVLMDASLYVNQDTQVLVSEKVNNILQEINESYKGDPKILMYAGEMANALLSVMSPMLQLVTPLVMSKDTVQYIERVDKQCVPINRPVKVYLRGIKLVKVA